MNPVTGNLNSLRRELLQTITGWACHGKSPRPAAMHMPHIIYLLQSVGFCISRIDSSAPESITPLRNGQQGTRVVITCGHSGQRYYLEMPEQPEKCICLTRPHDSREQFWEVTGKNNSVIESGSDVIPPLSKDLNCMLSTMLTILTHFIQGTSTKEDMNSTTPTATSSPNKDAKRLSGFMKELGPTITITSPSNADTSSLSSKSLDVIPQTGDQENSGSSLLPTTPNLSQSSPNLSAKENQSGNQTTTPTTPTNISDKKVVKLLEKAIIMIEKKKKNVTPTQRTFSVGKTKSVSSPNLSTKNKAVSPVPAKGSAKKASVKPLPSKAPATKFPVKTTPTVSAKTPRRVEPKTNEEQNKSATNKPKKVINLYAHVKSTIPKPSPVGKVVKKK